MGDRAMRQQGRDNRAYGSHYQPHINSAMHSHGRNALRNILSASRIQAKLTVGSPNDVYEKEADRVADQVMRMPDASLTGDSRTAVSSGSADVVQRACATCQEEDEGLIQTKPLANAITPLVQRKASVNSESTVSSNIEAGISSLKGDGRPMNQSERSFFEPRFGTDFGNVRLHEDSRAANLAQSVNARAFTLGNDVVFGAGQYQAQSNTSRHLLSHELTHVIQQSGNHALESVQRKSLQEAANVFDLDCSCGEALANNCAHYLSDAMIDAGYSELDGGIGGMYRRRNGFVVCKHGRPVRAKEMRDWFATEGTVENAAAKPDGYYAVYQQRDSDSQGHVTIKQCAGGACTQPGNTWGFAARDWETYYSF
ncbi:DUF4157 domain-containing protein [Pseudomonadota bacterium]